ncbi:peptidylprolyl isomerase [Lactococcus insecticola]|uniref:Peptidyl-prolyl cis-trans isomerase n=1 Tax=Pseudolactococcus insecticola TaxID=2709158 RepID=A0A6A0B6R6_9LACT|nr:peptidylprolyl isomerase [Lactococcus insecticola]GFH40191.1 peptidyl-prolyl cis-trans isomerase [Lactococcus insecticola]
MTTYPQTDLGKYQGTIATIHTNLGDLKVKLFDTIAPKTVKNFVELAEKGYYDGIIFHRVIRDFMIQGGDPTGTGMGGESIYGEKFDDEFSDNVYNIRGALSMANAGPNTNGSQFFIVQNENLPYDKDALIKGGWPDEIAEIYTAGGTPHLDGRHTVFGQLADTDSFATLDRIAKEPVGFQDKPENDVVITSIDLEKVATAAEKVDIK